MRLWLILVALLALSISTFAQAKAQGKSLPPVAERLAAQNALFDEQYEAELREFPDRATSFGDYRYNDKLAERSLAAIQRREKADEAFLGRLEAIATDGFPEQDQLSHDILMRGLEQRVADFQLKEHEMPVNQFSGIHTTLDRKS